MVQNKAKNVITLHQNDVVGDEVNNNVGLFILNVILQTHYSCVRVSVYIYIYIYIYNQFVTDVVFRFHLTQEELYS